MLNPRDVFILFVTLCLATLASVALAADEAPKVDLSLLQALIVAVIPVVTGIVMVFVKNAVARIPNAYIPVLAPVVGLVVEAVAQAFGMSLVPGVDGAGALPVAAALGSTSVGLHQIKAQLAGR